jgi:hypothetical protein
MKTSGCLSSGLFLAVLYPVFIGADRGLLIADS